MRTCKKDEYSEIAKKASVLLKDGIGIAEIVNSTQKKLMYINKLDKNINRKNS